MNQTSPALRHRVRRASSACAAVIVVALGSTSAHAQPVEATTASSGCGLVNHDYRNKEHGGAGVKITRVRGVTCKQARHIMVRCILDAHVTHWRSVHMGGLRYALRSGARSIRYTVVAGGSPSC